MSALKQTQIAVIKYLRETIGENVVGDSFPNNNNMDYFILLKDTSLNDVSVKDNKRTTLSFTFVVNSDAALGSGLFLNMIDVVDSLEDAELLMDGYTVDNVEQTAFKSYVTTTVDKKVRTAVIMVDITVSKKL